MSVHTVLPANTSVGDAWRLTVAAPHVRQILDCFYLLSDGARVAAGDDAPPVALPAPGEFGPDTRAFVQNLIDAVCGHPDAHAFSIQREGAASHYVYVLAALLTLYAMHQRTVVFYLVDPAHRGTGIPYAAPWIRIAEDHKGVSAHSLVTHAQRLRGIARYE
jgi:hypothetical protein